MATISNPVRIRESPDGRLFSATINGVRDSKGISECRLLDLSRTDRPGTVVVMLPDYTASREHSVVLTAEGITALKETCERLLREGV
ncbi:MAG: hypothetical protein ABSE71_01165 [Candidatus Micrarchaeaceae archaeon]|jgi:hypothetical protein|nr:hypothetical protein [Candidatus Micrarchaeota archaeon]HII09891.1 hypothetical protein [Candidatus Micrarchaeota archaeon]